MHHINYPLGGTSVLASLRAMLPERPLSLSEALAITERQADRLIQLRRSPDVPIPTSIVTDLPRITAEYDPALPSEAASGASHWNASRRTWIISINPDEPFTRQRFTVLHEYKHIIDYGHAGLTGQLPRTIYGLDPVEYLAEYFAGCVLMPKLCVKRAFYDGIQNTRDLAQLFDVSSRAIEVRLQQLCLSDSQKGTDTTSTAQRVLRRQPRRAAHYYRSKYRHLGKSDLLHGATR